MAMSQRSRTVLYEGLCQHIDEAAVAELLSFFPVRDVGEPSTREGAERRHAGIDATADERLVQIEGRLAGIEALAADLRAGLARIEQRIIEREA
jgi:hypothetical protein